MASSYLPRLTSDAASRNCGWGALGISFASDSYAAAASDHFCATNASLAFCCAGDMACCGTASATVTRSVLMIIGPPWWSLGDDDGRCQRGGDERRRQGAGTPADVVNWRSAAVQGC